MAAPMADADLAAWAPANAGAARRTAGLPPSLLQADKQFGLLSLERLDGAKAQKTPRPAASGAADLFLLRFSSSADPREICDFLNRQPGIRDAEPDYLCSLALVPGDPHYPQQASDLSAVGIESAWDVQTGAVAVKVAILDTGIDLTHEDLADRLGPGYDFHDNEADADDDNGHGTRVAGIVGAIANNGKGIAGVAHGVTLLPYDVADPYGAIPVSSAIEALHAATAAGASVINMSFRTYGYSANFEAACAAAAQTALLVAGAGNEGQGDQPVYPASFDSVLGVAALGDSPDARAAFSNYNGREKTIVELAAPGATIFSTIPGSDYNGSFGTGTSFACPIVSGAAALLKSRYPDQPTGAIRRHLADTAAALGEWAGAGRLDIAQALSQPLAPEIVLDFVTVDDDPAYDPANNGNGILNPGESAKLIVGLTSNKATAANATATLSTACADIGPIGGAVAAFGAISFGAAADNAADPFAPIAVSAAAPSQRASFHLALAADGGYADSISFSLPIEDTYSPPAIIGANTTWTADTTYVIEQNTVVMPGIRLTISPGTTVKFGEQGALEIRGRIASDGTSAAPVEFTSISGMPGGGLAPEQLHAGVYAYNMRVGDVDNDGDNDMVFALSAENRLRIFRWNGAGHDSPIEVDVGQWPFHLCLGDADNDGDVDIVAGNVVSGDISIVRWNGAGFSEVRQNAGSTPSSVVVGDADNDGDNDLLWANGGGVSLMRWNGAGFDPAVSFAASGASAVAIGDADNDGDNDIVANGVWLIRWNGAGFDSPLNLPAPGNAVCVGDADNDGDNDIITSGIAVLAWNGAGFNAPVVWPGAGDSIAIADFEGDGDNDLLTHQSDRVLLTRWSGGGFVAPLKTLLCPNVYSVCIGDADNDGRVDILAANVWDTGAGLQDGHGYWLIRWDPRSSCLPMHKGIWIRSTATQARFTHCAIRFGGVLDQSTVGNFQDCFFDRPGGDFGLSSVLGTNPVVRCSALNRFHQPGSFSDMAYDGIRAETKALIDCSAEGCGGVGLRGGALSGCVARGNGKTGMECATASGCVAENNGSIGISATGLVSDSQAHGNASWGVWTTGNVLNAKAARNANGIRGAAVENCEAWENLETGILAAVSAARCRAANNRGQGIAGASLTDCVVVDNAQGLALSGVASGCLVAQNQGAGATGGTIQSSSIVYNSGVGSAGASSLSNCWLAGNAQHGALSADSLADCGVLNNAGFGILGKAAAPWTAVARCIVRDNGLSGIKNSGTVSGSHLLENGGAGGYDYEDSRLSSALIQVNLSGNWWGPATTALMNAHPWGSYYNIPAIYDLLDDATLCEARYEGHLQEPGPAGPDSAPPAFLLSVQPNPANAVNAVLTTFSLCFSEAMDTSTAPTVAFGRTAPYADHVVAPSPGWLAGSDRVWQGAFAVSSSTGDGMQTIRVSGARAADGFGLPDDTAHRFIIDTSGGGIASNGLAIGTGVSQMFIAWEPAGPLLGGRAETASLSDGVLGYNIHRAAAGAGGVAPDLAKFDRINTEPIKALEYSDSNLQSATMYYYIVYALDAQNSATQHTGLFAGETWAVPPPAAPVLDAEPAYTAGTANTVSWAAVSAAAEYYLEWAPNAAFAAPAGSGWTPSTSRTASPLADGSTYYYRAKARNAGGESGWSVVVSSTQDAKAPETAVLPLPARFGVPAFTVRYGGGDSGSGLQAVELYYRKDSGSWTKWPAPFADSLVFDTRQTGGDGVYRFYSKGTDKVGNIEPFPGTYDAMTEVDTQRETQAGQAWSDYR